jgi:hypothetical protein
MNTTAATSTFGPLIAFFAGLLAGKGVFGLDAATWTTVIGSVVAAGLSVWGAISTRKTAQISAVAAMPEVQSVKLEPSAPSSITTATPSNVSK